MKKIAIMQPTYLPWIGYFGLMAAVDEFVLLDDVQFTRRSWQQRNRIKSAGGPVMLTIPVFKKGKRDQNINEVEMDWSTDFSRKHFRSIESAYARAPFWSAFGGAIGGAINRKTPLLSDYTIAIIQELRDTLGIKTPLVRSSTFMTAGKREHLLVEICKALDAGIYVSPPGSHAYLDKSDALEQAGIELQYNDYQHPVYPQLHGEFISHLSLIDLLLNCGNDSLEVLKGGVRISTASPSTATPNIFDQ